MTHKQKERVRRAQLHREIGALYGDLNRVLAKHEGRFTSRSGRLLGKIQRKERELVQPSLF